MPWAWLSLGCIPLFLYLGLHLMEAGFELRKTQGQTKIDALSLSLCHRLRAHMEETNKSWNDRIEALQVKMNTLVASCLVSAATLSLTGGPSAFAAHMRLCNLQLSPLSIEGKAFQAFQEVALHTHIRDLKKFSKELAQRNQLEDAYKVQGLNFLALRSALKRDELDSLSKSFENLIARFGKRQAWPRVWVARKSIFPLIFRIESQHSPKTWVSWTDIENEHWKPIAELKSECWLEEVVKAKKYEVKRK